MLLQRKQWKRIQEPELCGAIIEEFMLDIMYEIPKDDSIGEVIITRAYIEGTGGPVIRLRGQEVPMLEQNTATRLGR